MVRSKQRGSSSVVVTSTSTHVSTTDAAVRVLLPVAIAVTAYLYLLFPPVGEVSSGVASFLLPVFCFVASTSGLITGSRIGLRIANCGKVLGPLSIVIWLGTAANAATLVFIAWIFRPAWIGWSSLGLAVTLSILGLLLERRKRT